MICLKVRYDERNTMFSRVRLKPNTEHYKTYYNDKPDLKAVDDALRLKAIRDGLRASDAFKARFFPLTNHNNAVLKSLHDTVDATPLGKRVNVGRAFATNIKATAKHYGAADVGIVKLKADHYYQAHGGVSEAIGKNNYGAPIVPRYTHAIVYAIPMALSYINRSPHYESMLETENAYLKIAFTGARLALYLKQLGYKSVFQSEAYYETPMVPLAYDAGLGQIGMANHIVHPHFGNRIRLGAVLTTMSLEEDQPIDFNLEAFCKRCALCLMNCPSHSIKPGKRMRNGRPFYRFIDHTCYAMWLRSGTDCGTCIQSCPFTQGIDLKKVKDAKDNTQALDQLLEEHIQKHSRRPFVKEPLDIVKLGGDKDGN